MRVACEEVTKEYGSVRAVDRLNLAIESGEFVVLVGPSGCGKTTTLRMIAGLEDITSGRILFGETCINDVPPRFRDAAMVFQAYALYPHMTVSQNIEYPLKIRKVAPPARLEKAKRVAEMLGIARLLERRPRELSGGERQRVALARAIVREPKVCLMDEPLSNLDAKLRLEMRGELKRLQYELGTTTIYVTHDQAEAMTLAHRVAVMSEGRLQQFDSPMDVYRHPANRFVASFVGSPSMNLINGRVDFAERRFAGTGFSIELGEGSLARLAGRESVTIGIRPEDLRLSTEAAPSKGTIDARVYVTELLGSETYVFVRIGGESAVARIGPDIRPEIDSTVKISFDETRLHFFDGESGSRIG